MDDQLLDDLAEAVIRDSRITTLIRMFLNKDVPAKFIIDATTQCQRCFGHGELGQGGCLGKCPDCDGAGRIAPEGFVRCDACDGSGEHRDFPNGSNACGACNGFGSRPVELAKRGKEAAK
jgi:DnaJ-class molecular chaperone